MFEHSKLGNTIEEIRRNLSVLIHSNQVRLGGYKKNKIYGTLHCSSGRRMKMENRVFFKDDEEAERNGYRPCGHCMHEKYSLWKSNQDRMVFYIINYDEHGNTTGD